MVPKKRKTGETPLIPVTVFQFRALGASIMGRDPEGKSAKVFEDRWVSFFGVTSNVCVQVWNLIQVPVHCDSEADAHLSYARPEHFLWVLFLKKYGDEQARNVSSCRR
jgi:hypothetical protein